MENIKNIINETKTLTELTNLGNVIKEMIENKRTDLNIKISALDLSNKSFHCLKETFENMSPELFKTVEGRKILGNYKNILKENKSLNILMNAHENFRRMISESSTNMLVDEIAKYNEKVNKVQLNEGIETLRGLVYASYKLLGENANSYIVEDNENYSNAIKYIVENKKAFINLVDFANATYIINENIKNRVNNEEDVTNLEILSNDIDRAYSRVFVKESKNEHIDDKEKIFNTYKQECLNKINESLSLLENEEEKNKVKKIYEQVEGKVYCKETIDDDVLNLIGITKCF